MVTIHSFSSMRRAVTVLVCLLWTACEAKAPAPAAPVPVVVDIDATRSDFTTRHKAVATTPEGAVELLVEAAILASDPESAVNRQRGRIWLQLLFIPYREDADWHKRPSNRTFVERLDVMPWIFRSYLKGTSPKNAYTIPTGPRTIDLVRSEPRSGGGHTVVIRSSGADQPRPIVVKQSEQSGLWYVDQLANLYVDIRLPRKAGSETFR